MFLDARGKPNTANNLDASGDDASAGRADEAVSER